jgi:glycosyltransferase involved in cell wall biosynthesis
VGALVRPALTRLRRLDRQAAAGHRSYAAISKVAAQRVKAVYGRDAQVIHAPVWTGHLPDRPPPLPREPGALVVARLLPYTRIDVALSACRLTGVPLTIVGKGPDEARLRRLAGPQVTFLSDVPDEEMGELFASHSVVLAPGLEDFGYGPVEANYSGRPVVALSAGGALETVRDQVTGRLVTGHRGEDWAWALQDVLAREWSPAALRAATESFQAPAFERAIRRWISEG